MYRIVLSDKAKRQLKKLSENVRDRIGSVIERLKIRPYSHVKRIIGSSYFGARARDYRIILDIVDKNLIIYVIELGHRKNIYK